MITWLVVAVTAAATAMPHVKGIAPLLAGRATINLAPAEYEVCPGLSSTEMLDLTALAAGWRLAERGAVSLPTRSGAVTLRAYTAGTSWLLQGVTDGPEPVTVRARLERMPVWVDPSGEAAGREPAGSPRPVSSRRLLHVTGDGFEAACYRSAAPPPVVLRDAGRRLAWRGWNAAPLGDTGFLAAKPGSSDLAWYVRPDGAGSLVLLVASERTP